MRALDSGSALEHDGDVVEGVRKRQRRQLYALMAQLLPVGNTAMDGRLEDGGQPKLQWLSPSNGSTRLPKNRTSKLTPRPRTLHSMVRAELISLEICSSPADLLRELNPCVRTPVDCASG